MKEIRKTKIICTLGPSTDEGDVLRQLMLAGMNVARVQLFPWDTRRTEGAAGQAGGPEK